MVKKLDPVQFTVQTNLNNFKKEIRESDAELRKLNKTGDKTKKVSKEIDDRTKKQKNSFKGLSQDIKKLEKEQGLLNKRFKSGVVGIDKYGKRTDEIRGKIQKLQATQEKAYGKKTMSRLTKSVGAFGSALSFLAPVSFGLAISQGIKNIINVGKEFEKQMSVVRSVTLGTEEDFEKLRKKALELGSSTPFKAKEAAEGMEFLARAGLETNEILSAIPITLKLAQATAQDLGTTADIVTNILGGFGAEVQELERFAEVLALTTSKTNTNISELGEGMKFAAPKANQLGVSIEETAAFLGKFADSGIKGTLAGTGFQAMLTRLASPTAETRRKLEELGIEVFNEEGEFRGLTKILNETRVAFEDLNPEQEAAATKAIAGVLHQKTFAIAVNATGGEVEGLTEKLVNANGTLDEMSRIMEDNLQGDLDKLGSAWEGFTLSLFDGVNPALRVLTKLLTGVVGGVKVLGRVLGLVSDTVVSLGITIFKGAIAPFKSLGGIISAFPRLLKGDFSGFGNAIKKAFVKPMEDVKQSVKTGTEFVSDSFGKVNKAIEDMDGTTARRNKKEAEETKKRNKEILEEKKKDNEKSSEDIKQITVEREADLLQIIRDAETDKEDVRKRFREGFIDQKKFNEEFDSIKNRVSETAEVYEKAFGRKIPSELQKFTKSAKDMQKETEKSIEVAKKESEDFFKSFIRNSEKAVNAAEKFAEKSKKFFDDLEKDMRETDNKLLEISVETSDELAKIFLESKEKQKSLRDQIRKEKDAEKKRELNDELAKQKELENQSKKELEKEIGVSPAKDLLKETEKLSKENEVERLIREKENEKAILTERLGILEKISNGEKINFEEINDFKNLEFAKELEMKREAMDQELKIQLENIAKLESSQIISIKTVESAEINSIAKKNSAYETLIAKINSARESLRSFNDEQDRIAAENVARSEAGLSPKKSAFDFIKNHEGATVSKTSSDIGGNLKSNEVNRTLEVGEEVIKKSSANKYRGILKQINNKTFALPTTRNNNHNITHSDNNSRNIENVNFYENDNSSEQILEVLNEKRYKYNRDF